jgi:hypothetical protein
MNPWIFIKVETFFFNSEEFLKKIRGTVLGLNLLILSRLEDRIFKCTRITKDHVFGLIHQAPAPERASLISPIF